MKIFACSDIHGFYNEFIDALNKAGFEQNNPEHLLIVCGDVFDRGSRPFQVMSYLNKTKNCVLVRGNHESLLIDCIDRGYPTDYDYSNGTYKTIMSLAKSLNRDYTTFMSFDEACMIIERPIKKFVNKMVNYYETKNYIFVHSWVPLNCDDGLPFYYAKNRKFSKIENWREANENQWEEARWENPFDMAEEGLMPNKPHLVVGHWHCSAGWSKKLSVSEFGNDAIFDPFFDDCGLIAIDACTAHSKKVNVLMIEDELLN